MKNNYNTLQKYILDYSIKEYRKETINGLFRSILQPIISNQKFECCILFNLFNDIDFSSIIKRLSFSGAKLYSYSDSLCEFRLENLQKNNIWGNTEFVIVLGQRYSVALIWDYSLSELKDCTPVCVLYNSNVVTDIVRTISNNSVVDLSEYIQKYTPDRRDNTILNQSISSILSLLDDKNQEIIFSEYEKSNLINTNDSLKTAEIVSEKAKFIAHEIKNNLSIINLYSRIVEKRLENLEKDEEVEISLNNSIKNIMNASENVSSLISDLRCLSAPYKVEVNLRSLILNTVIMCEEKANNSGIKISVNKFDDCVLNTDKIKVQCALTNLIFNAIEACKEKCSIVIDCFIESNVVKIFVKNNGEKIEKDIQSKIFDINFTTKATGNGLGLAICKQQMKLLDGDIILVHSNDVETLFEISLPLD